MKNNFSRRKFIKSSVYAAAATSITATVGCGGDIPTVRSAKKAAVIGSGFGGSVAALRLGQAGFSTALIERGLRWSYNGPDSYPTLQTMVQGDGRTTWLSDFDAPSGQIPVNRYTGMLERIAGDTVDSVVGAGLGGGSLVYGGVLLQPREEIFSPMFPYIDYGEMASEFYPKVLAQVSGGPVPDDILATPFYKAKQAFIKNATSAGFTVKKSDVGFNWNIIRKELTGELPYAASIGEYVFSCNSGAKNTLDKNYIADAEATGNVSVHTLHNVKSITQFGRKGPYIVHCEVLDPEGNVLMNHIIGCEYLFMAAGSINTSRLLLKAKAMGDLKGINDQIGQNWAANGDELMARIGVQDDLGPVQGGPPSIAAWDFNNSIKPVGFMHSPANSAPGQPPTQLQMAMCAPDQFGSISYVPETDKAFINWPMDDNNFARQAHMESLMKLSAFSGGMPLPDTAMGRPTMWHPLGGATMGEATDTETGEVFGQPNLFVMDGALMPGATAASNPSLTIAANAERIMANLIPRLC
ncbi:MAG: cholesterol oxidase [Pseudomonadales bacterium]|nr:cholesterol oxidase [Pseudomonadales bacterium]RLU02631.1 MAG: GMC family oxidoreductase [Ketobacter sp.]